MSPRSRKLLVAAVAALVAAAACSTQQDFTASPNLAVVGTWSSANAIFVSSHSGATLQMRCVTAEFAPIVLDDTLGFTVVGTVASATGLVLVKQGDPFVLQGHSVGTQMILTAQVIGTDTLALGGGAEPLVCNA